MSCCCCRMTQHTPHAGSFRFKGIVRKAPGLLARGQGHTQGFAVWEGI